MMVNINSEFQETIYSNTKNNKLQLPPYYWVALTNHLVIGTVGLVIINQEYAILKRMMLIKAYRGKKLGVSQALLQTAILCCKEHNINDLYLGTMTQFKAAQSFYLKNGFKEIQENQTPKGFLKNPVDKLFYHLQLQSDKL